MKKLSTLFASLLFLFSAHATLYTGSLSSATGTAGSAVTVTFNLTSGPAISELVIYSSILGTVTPLTTANNPVFGIYNNNYTATFTVPSGYPNGTPVFFTISTNPFGTVYGNTSPFPMYTILPITYISNSAKYIEAGNKVALNWKIGSADGVKEFKVMRSTDGFSFTTIGTVLPGSTTDYTYEDYLPNTAVNYYYKISGVTMDGMVKETGRMLIKKSDKNAAPVILNSGNVKNELLVTGVNLMDYKAGEIKVFDVTGRSYTAAIQSSNSIYVTTLSAGMYFLKIKDLPALRFIEK
ncbi:T9SS type A sorting domain-containing protein [Ferruginibacter sp. SUN106]|uniref:T9SS type A sorting domain-containing protein n=1 Tax=Ferruginibacter sp. SUN106 TaxID=2978348 RepID=UPI003D361916